MPYTPHRLPDDCSNMNEIRSEIDNIDYAIIQLLSIRFGYVKAASKFKKILPMFKPVNVLKACLKNASTGQKSKV